MNSGARKFLWITHLAVLGLGVALGLRGSLEPKTPDLPARPIVSTPSSPNSRPVPESAAEEAPNAVALVSSADYATAWDSLKGRFLPRQERLLIEKTLLEEWSVVDLTAAVRAVFAETTDQGPSGFGKVGILSLLDCCAPGIKADPRKAWELVRSHTFGLETGRFRKAWVDCLMEANPVIVFSILDELPKVERLTALGALAVESCNAEDSAKRASIWAHLSALPDSPAEQEFLTRIGEFVSSYTPSAELVTRLQGELTPSGRKICIAALSIAPFEFIDRDDFLKLLVHLPAATRGEIAAAGIKHGKGDEESALVLADVALDSGNLDALQTAAADPAYARFANEMRKPLALVDWALRLPEDSRTLEIYRQSIEGAAGSDFEEVQMRIHSLPPGWQRDQGMAALAKVKKQRDTEEE